MLNFRLCLQNQFWILSSFFSPAVSASLSIDVRTHHRSIRHRRAGPYRVDFGWLRASRWMGIVVLWEWFWEQAWGYCTADKLYCCFLPGKVRHKHCGYVFTTNCSQQWHISRIVWDSVSLCNTHRSGGSHRNLRVLAISNEVDLAFTTGTATFSASVISGSNSVSSVSSNSASIVPTPPYVQKFVSPKAEPTDKEPPDHPNPRLPLRSRKRLPSHPHSRRRPSWVSSWGLWP